MKSELAIDVAIRDDILTVTAHGDIDLTTYQHLLVAAEPGAPAGTVVLDLTDVGFCDSAGLGALVRIYKATKRAGQRLILRGPSPGLRRLFELTGLDAIFTVEPSAPAA